MYEDEVIALPESLCLFPRTDCLLALLLQFRVGSPRQRALPRRRRHRGARQRGRRRGRTGARPKTVRNRLGKYCLGADLSSISYSVFTGRLFTKTDDVCRPELILGMFWLMLQANATQIQLSHNIACMFKYKCLQTWSG